MNILSVSLLLAVNVFHTINAGDEGIQQQSAINSQLLPPGSLGSGANTGFNVTGPLHSFIEQLQNSRSAEPVVVEAPGVSIPQPPIVQMPSNAQGQRGSVIYYGQNPIAVPGVQSAPPVGPQNRPALDPALQQLLNSFNTNPDQNNRNTFIQPSQVQAEAPAISYITCYVGCSHVTNIVTNEATPKYTPNPLFSILIPILSSMVVLVAL